jgi:hypothetical protein
MDLDVTQLVERVAQACGRGQAACALEHRLRNVNTEDAARHRQARCLARGLSRATADV